MAVPVVLLGGKSDIPVDYGPGSLGNQHKLFDLEYRGAPLVSHLLSTCTAIRQGGAPVFNPIYLAGPLDKSRDYCGSRSGAEILPIDTDGKLHQNLRNVQRMLVQMHGGDLSLIMTGDLAPREEDMEGLAALLEQHSTADAIIPMIDAAAMRRLGVEKRVYSLTSGEKYCWGQSWGVRPEQIRWRVMRMAARIGYAIRKGGMKRRISKARVAGVVIPHSLNPFNYRSTYFLATNLRKILDSVRRVGEGAISRHEAEGIVEDVLLKGRRQRGQRRAIISVTDLAGVGADLDYMEDLEQISRHA